MLPKTFVGNQIFERNFPTRTFLGCILPFCKLCLCKLRIFFIPFWRRKNASYWDVSKEWNKRECSILTTRYYEDNRIFEVIKRGMSKLQQPLRDFSLFWPFQKLLLQMNGCKKHHCQSNIHLRIMLSKSTSLTVYCNNPSTVSTVQLKSNQRTSHANRAISSLCYFLNCCLIFLY
jgi:hypothetical protein